jgi:hypothetical protein
VYWELGEVLEGLALKPWSSGLADEGPNPAFKNRPWILGSEEFRIPVRKPGVGASFDARQKLP